MKRVLPLLGYLFLRSLHATLRVRHVGQEGLVRLPQAVIAFWHDHLLLMLHSRYRKPVTVMSSQSKDGELMVRMYAYYGVASVRGSSTRGGSGALRGMIRSARDGASIAFTPDGPRGPARVVKDGVIYAAQTTGLPIIPIAFGAKKKSFCGRGTGCSSRCRSQKCCSSTAIRSSWPAAYRSRKGGSSCSGRSTFLRSA